MPALDYDRLADLYDAYCRFEGDLPFFRRLAREADGPILELMAGTGRVTLPMIEEGGEVVVVDRFCSMMSRLRSRCGGRGISPLAVVADVTALPFGAAFRLVVLPFQGFTELVSEAEQRALFRSVAAALAEGGRFVCTSHDPAVRGATVDGRRHRLGAFPLPDGGSLVLSLETRFSDRPGVVTGRQTLARLDPGGDLLEERRVEIRFALVPADRMVAMAAAAGLRLVGLAGDYDGGPYAAGESPVIVATFERVA